MTKTYPSADSIFSAMRNAFLGSALLLVLADSSTIALAQTAPSPVESAAGAPAAAKIPVLSRAQIDALLAQPDKVIFIDVRRPDEVSDIGGFPAYLSIQLSELDRFLSVIPKDRQIVVVSNHAARGAKGAELLASKGFNVVGAAGAESYEKEGGALSNKKTVTPEIPGVVKGGTLVNVVREGFQGTEGPAVIKDGSILFTENRAGNLVKIAANGTISTYLSNSGGANALAVGANGEVYAVDTATGSIGVVQLEPTKKLITVGPKGRGFVRPNDFARSSSGNFYVSDPGAVQRAQQAERSRAAGQNGVVQAAAVPPQPVAPIKTGFYWVNPRGKVTLVADDIAFPNGVALSPDEKTVYVADTAGEALIAFAVNADGSLTGRRDFAKLAGVKNGRSGADGIAVDRDGRVYVATNAGVEVLDATGAALGVIKVPRKPQNLAFGGPDRSRLFVVGGGSVFRIQTLTKGPDRLGK